MKFFNGLIPLVLISTSTNAWALTETRVTLLGQPCQLEGPSKYKEGNLIAIHSIGPAQINPNLSFPESLAIKDQLGKQIEKVHKNPNLPSFPLLDAYREKLEKRLRAQIDLINSLEDLGKNTAALKATEKHILTPETTQKFDTLFQKVVKLGKPSGSARGHYSDQYGEMMNDLFELYNTGIGDDPQNDFYSALNKMDIRYQCSLEYNEDPAAGD